MLIFGTGIWFGNRTEKILINPNQCQAFCIPICDDPNNQHSPLEIGEEFNTYISMPIVVCGCMTLYPIDDDIETYEHVTVSY